MPAFYALKDTRTPALISVFSVVLNIFFCFQLRGAYGFVGLALAASLAGVANFALLTYLLRSRIDMTGDRDNLIALGKIVAASLVTGSDRLVDEALSLYANSALTPGQSWHGNRNDRQ